MLLKIINCQPNIYSEDRNRLLALTNILKSHGERKNIAILETEALNEIINSKNYGCIEKIYAQDILNDLREIRGLTAILEIHIEIDFSREDLEPIFYKDRKAVLVSYDFFTDPIKINHPSLVAENETDYKLYTQISNIYVRHSLKIPIGIGFDFCLGAGSTSKSEFDRLTAQKKIVLCIVDCDRSHPNKGEGETSRAFCEQDRFMYLTSHVKVLQHREAESLIPIKIIEEIVTEKIREKVSAIDEIKLCNSIDNSFTKYFDLKKGMLLNEMISLDKAHGIFWTNILSKNPKFSSKNCIVTKEASDCEKCKECPKIEGISENLLDHAIDKIDGTSTQHTFKNLDSSLKDEWIQIGHLIASWGCHLKHSASRT